jgi:uncharacterized protein YbjT (DUF2867 family)
LFPNGGDLIQVVKGDFTDLSPIKEGIKNHTRLFLLMGDFSQFVKNKETIARYAYEAGVKQIVDLSSFTVNMGWRTSTIGSHHYHAEKAMFDIPNRGYFVALRPGRFMSNHFGMFAPRKDGAISDICDPDLKIGWISTDDIGAVAAVVLREDIHKHGDGVYNLTSDILSLRERAAIFSRIIGQEVKAETVTPTQLYKRMVEVAHFPHLMAIDLVDNLAQNPLDFINPVIEILLGRKPQTLEEYMTLNKASLK